ncbi:MAG TPA: NAD+ synthase [Cyanobacteria bacterium UBA9971]|nr:NAD+ synthase [Cyanobacteria bacterium UBA9971]
MKIALCQINTKVGDLQRNTDLIVKNINKAKEKRIDLIVFTELSITGYPPKDLLDFECFVNDNLKCLDKIRAASKDIAVICGYIDINPNATGKKCYNAAAFINNGEIIAKYYKRLLPFYDVFDETRYFEPGQQELIIDFKGKKLGITICEDLWNDKDYWKRQLYHVDPAEKLVKDGINAIINISASPYLLNKEKNRFAILKNTSVKNNVPIVYVNQVGGNDDLLFDGVSFVIDSKGEIKCLCKDFEEDFAVYDFDSNTGDVHDISQSEEESLFKALCTGIKDYCGKIGFKKVVLGLSGGIDSAVTAVLAVCALGKENVTGITMPSMYSSEGSVSDSEILAKNLDIEFLNIPIINMFNSYIDTIQKKHGKTVDLAEENLQARIRANILMMHSNRYGHLLLTTGNKSELSVGYCTLYGDMCGGLAVLSDVPKVMVYRLAKYINRINEIIPEDTITKPPSAELRPDQKDMDSLPPYEILDDILKMFVEENKSIKEMSKKYPEELVKDIVKKINNCEYKRRQAALGLKVTTKAFGVGRRFPIVQGYDFSGN